MKKITVLLIVLLVISFQLNAKVLIVKDGKPVGRIVLTTSNAEDKQAADLFQDFTKRISQVVLPIVETNKIVENDIVIGNGTPNKNLFSNALAEDGFRIKIIDNKLHIVSGGGYGSVYAVVTLLERYMGVSYWGEKEYSLTPGETIMLQDIDVLENPTFRYRQSQNYAMRIDPVYKL